MVFMARLAKLASIYEKVQTMEWTIFNMQPVEDIMQELRAWPNPEDVDAEDVPLLQDDPDDQRDRFHCIEAWRQAVLLYAYRVFFRPQTSSGLQSITHLARTVLDHVRCVPQTVIVQKQTLLPVFLAASEVGNEATRDFVRQYCDHWSQTARYSMFATVRLLLERIWQKWKPSTRDAFWWGSIVGRKHSDGAEEDDTSTMEILLG